MVSSIKINPRLMDIRVLITVSFQAELNKEKSLPVDPDEPFSILFYPLRDLISPEIPRRNKFAIIFA
jgi:hypothetical protein